MKSLSIKKTYISKCEILWIFGILLVFDMGYLYFVGDMYCVVMKNNVL